MTEAVILALIALLGIIVFVTSTIILVRMVLKSTPDYFKFETEHGHVEIRFDNEADE